MYIERDLVLDYRTYRKIAFMPNSHLWPWIFRALGVLAAAGTAWFASSFSWRFVGGVMAVALFFGPTTVTLQGLRRLRASGVTSFRYEISDEGIRTGSEIATRTVRWDAISRVQAARDAWVLRLSGTLVGIVIPRFAFSAAEQNEIDAYLAARFPALKT